MKLLQQHTGPIFDYVFIDGAHTWNVDGLTFFLVDLLLRPGGYVDFDDYSWSLANSPSLRPSVFPLTAELYTSEQISVAQVSLIVDLLVKPNPRYQEVVPNKIYRKLRSDWDRRRKGPHWQRPSRLHPSRGCGVSFPRRTHLDVSFPVSFTAGLWGAGPAGLCAAGTTDE